jgi:Mechanosensitive ion channel, conserved TM helix
MGDRWPGDVWSGLLQVRERLLAVIPGLLVLVTLLAVGFVLGWLARAVVSRISLAVGVDRLFERWGLAPSLRRSGILRLPSEVLGLVCFWAIFILFASVGVDGLALPGAPGATALLVAFLPPLFAAALILLVGWLVANFLSQGVLIAAVNARLPEARLLARGVHWGVLLFAAATALTHLGIGKEMVLVAFGVTFGGVVFALALAFGLGGRHIARHILERRLRREAPPQEHITHL